MLWFKPVLNFLASPLETMWRKMTGCTWVLHSLFFLFLCISWVYMIWLPNSEFNQLLRKSLIFPPTPDEGSKWQIWKCHHLPYRLLAKFNPAHENNAANNRKAHNFTGHQISTSQDGYFIVFSIFPLTCINFYCSHLSIPPTLKLCIFFTIQDP